ncbi:MAG: MarP family serine protease [Acidimicrobiales bacterium]
MNLFDLIVIVLIVAAAIGGYRAGLITRVTSWIGLGLGLAAAVLIAPRLVGALRNSADPQMRALIAVAVLVLVASFGATLGEMVGISLRRFIPSGAARQLDRAGGAVVAGFGVLVLVWLLLPALAEVPGDVSAQVRNSRIARAVDQAAPSAPAPLQALRDLVQDANFPEVFSGLRPSPGGGPPPESTALSPELVQQVGRSTVRVSGEACSHVLEGSGFAAENDVVVTNAHVIAGVDQPTVQTPEGRRVRARVAVFDPVRDLAVLEAPGLGETPLPLGRAEVGDEGAVFGHPGGQVDLEVSPARIVQRVDAVGRDIYGSRTSERDVLILAAGLRPGDSGGALVNTSGEVVGVAFAIAPDEPNTATALNSTEVRAVLAAPRRAPADTGNCIR